jgi:hypothetical protein
MSAPVATPRPVWRDPLLILPLVLFGAWVWITALSGFVWHDLFTPLLCGFLLALTLERRSVAPAVQRRWRIAKFGALIGATAVLIAKWAMLAVRWP